MTRLLEMVQQRVRESSRPPTINDGETPSSLQAPGLIRPEQLVAVIRKHIFYPQGTTVDPKIHDWATRITQAAFLHHNGSKVHIANASDNLILLATASSSSGMVTPLAATSTATETSSSSEDFRVIHMLSILEKLVSDDSSPRCFGELHEEDCRRINPILDDLWTAWLSSSSERPHAVSLVVVSSFLCLAGRAKNPLLIRSCWEHCCSRGMVVDSGAQLPATHPLLVEYGLALLGIGSPFGDVVSVLVGLEESAEGRLWVASEVLRRVAWYDPFFAHGLLLRMRRVGMDVTQNTIFELATLLIRHGHLEPAVSFLEEPIYKPYKARIISLVLSRNVDTPGSLPVEVVAKVVGAMAKLHPRTLRKYCSRHTTEAAILSVAHSAQVNLAIAIACHATRGSPFWLPPSIYTSLLELAIDHRQFKAACRLFEYARRTYPRNSNVWCCHLIKRLSHVGASNLARKLTKFLDPRRRRREGFSVTLAKRLAFRGDRPSRVRTLSLPRFLLLSSHPGQTPSRANPVHVIQTLTRAGRRHAAMKLFSRIRRNHDQEVQTAMANVILDASLMRDPHYHHGRMRKALGTLKHLVSEEEFVPDRVTVNILVKALLLWRSEVDRYAVRALFDRMVRGGYPTGGTVPSGEVPFGSEDGPGVGGLVLPKLDSRIELVRHVKPLYKMFAKAFFLRGDYAGAKKVVGILKLVKAEHDAEVRGKLGRGAVVERGSSRGR